MPVLSRFDNGDACGDAIVDSGIASIQVVNTLTNVVFVLAGASLWRSGQSQGPRNSGLALVAVGLLSGLYHATSLWVGFVLDISAMAVWGAVLVNEGLGLPALLLPSKFGSSAALWQRWRAYIAAFMGALAVFVPFVAFEFFVALPTTVWNLWSTGFVFLILGFALPSLWCLYSAELLRDYASRVILSILSIVIGGVFTQLIHLWCVPGIAFTAFPLHSFWHFFSGLAAWLCGKMLDDVIKGGPKKSK